MSNYWRLHCRDCDDDMGDSCGGALNHGEAALLPVIKHRYVLLAAYELQHHTDEPWWLELEINVRGASMNMDWLKKHSSHELIVADEYGFQYIDAHGKKFHNNYGKTDWVEGEP